MKRITVFLLAALLLLSLTAAAAADESAFKEGVSYIGSGVTLKKSDGSGKTMTLEVCADTLFAAMFDGNQYYWYFSTETTTCSKSGNVFSYHYDDPRVVDLKLTVGNGKVIKIEINSTDWWAPAEYNGTYGADDPVPPTGDNAPIALYALLCAFGAAGLALTLRRRHA